MESGTLLFLLDLSRFCRQRKRTANALHAHAHLMASHYELQSRLPRYSGTGLTMRRPVDLATGKTNTSFGDCFGIDQRGTLWHSLIYA